LFKAFLHDSSQQGAPHQHNYIINLQATASAADPFNLDTRWLAGWLAGLAGWLGWLFIDFYTS
jgi:hypothetical protein